MAQLSREKRIWAEEKDRMASPRVVQVFQYIRVCLAAHQPLPACTAFGLSLTCTCWLLQGAQEKWDQERRSLNEQHRLEVDDLMALLKAAQANQASAASVETGVTANTYFNSHKRTHTHTHTHTTNEKIL